MPGFQVEQQTSPVSKHSWGPLAALRASAAANQRRPRSKRMVTAASSRNSRRLGSAKH